LGFEKRPAGNFFPNDLKTNGSPPSSKRVSNQRTGGTKPTNCLVFVGGTIQFFYLSQKRPNPRAGEGVFPFFPRQGGREGNKKQTPGASPGESGCFFPGFEGKYSTLFEGPLGNGPPPKTQILSDSRARLQTAPLPARKEPIDSHGTTKSQRVLVPMMRVPGVVSDPGAWRQGVV